MQFGIRGKRQGGLMKLVLFDDFRPGVLVDGGVVDCSEAVPEATGVTAMRTVIERWDDVKPEFERLASTGTVIAIDQSRLRSPVGKPGKIMCMAANFREGTGAAPLPINGSASVTTRPRWCW
jgi:hypothetical protein